MVVVVVGEGSGDTKGRNASYRKVRRRKQRLPCYADKFLRLKMAVALFLVEIPLPM